MRKFFAITVILLLLSLGFGCTTIYKAAVDERDVKTIASDKKIEATIVKRLFEDDSVKVLDISTYCYDGKVYLVGEYETDKQKSLATRIAKNVEGVKSVTTYLLPKKKDHPCGTKENLEITVKVKGALIKDKEIWSTNVEVKTIQCKVVLLGIVGSEQEIDKAIAHAKSVEGVRSVKSYLKSAK
jgi:hyperosmotically inducible protein